MPFSPITVAMELDRRLDDNIAAINARLRTLDEQMRLADEILAEMDVWNPRTQESDDDAFDHVSIDDSDSGSDVSDISDEYWDDETVQYHTLDENRYFSDEDEDDQVDEETIVGDWCNPYVTPERRMDVVIPVDLEAGMEFLL